jgi:uncharacterized membrane protein
MTHLLLLAAAEKSAAKGFLGALHPGVVHFPIALLAVAAFLEFLQILRRKSEPAPGTGALAWLAVASAIPASLFGFMLADYEGSEGSLISLHKWTGVASTVVAVAAALCAARAKSSPAAVKAFRLALIVGATLVLSTGYLGGELVFGEGHLFKFFHAKAEATSSTDVGTADPKVLQKPAAADVAEKVDFVKEIAPIIKNDCFKCHGGEKVKGKFNLGSKKTAFDQAESGKAILPGKPDLSKFYKSMTLDSGDDDLMPPIKEKARPTKEQIERVRKWIEQGAEWPDGYEFKK